MSPIKISIDCQTSQLAEVPLTQIEIDQRNAEAAAWSLIQARREIDAQLAATDAGMARALEDLIAVLAAKGVLAEADLPAAAQQKLQTRRQLRQQRASI